MRYSSIVIALLAFVLLPAAAAWGAGKQFVDHGGAELSVAGPVRTPIRHKPYYVGEREQFGYNPRYHPGAVSFGPDNRPYIWTGKTVITLSDAGRWISLEPVKGLMEKYGLEPAAHIAASDPHIGFDATGDAYMVGRLGPYPGGGFQYGLFHSTDKCRSWTFYQAPNRPQRLERLGAYNQIMGPPPLVEGRGRELFLTVFDMKADGKLAARKLLTVAKVIPPVVRKGRHWITPAHSGCADVSATFAGKTHVVWLSIQPLSLSEEAAKRLPTKKQGAYVPYAMRYAKYGLGPLAPCYAATYDHKTGELSEPVIIGFTRRDNHNGPAICVDSKGYLNVIIGSHQDNFQYTRSLRPNSTTGGWTEPKMFGTPRPEGIGPGYTYIGLVNDADDTLHIVTRWADSRGYVNLTYLRKKAGKDWEPNKLLVIPFRSNYSVYYHKLNIDRAGRLFVNYSYYGAHLTEVEAQAYKNKWPEDNLRIPPGKKAGPGAFPGSRLGLRSHDPCLLISDDHGDTWRLAVTEDFIRGLKRGRK